jgi:phage shock protein C
MEKRLTRKNKMILGVCGGIADYFNMDASVVRLIAVALIFLGVGSPVLVYLVMAIVLPDETNVIG